MAIHPAAIVDPGARIHEEAQIGPYCVIGPEVEIGAGTRFLAHVFAEGPTTIGEDNVFFPYSTVGVAPQDLKYHGERAQTRIGDRNQVREFCTIHRGTEGGGSLTAIGNDNLLQAYAHVAHDCLLGSHCILSHSATLGGHVSVEDYAVVGAHCGVHQFCRIGEHCYIGGFSVITQDVLPFSVVVTERGARTFGVNKVGLERRGFAKQAIQALHNAVRTLVRSGLNTDQALDKILRDDGEVPEVARLQEFIVSSERGFVK
ncbi:MAG: acyl-ACP--UDP-N-acetylglucosamine O-acyltransferase [Bryobacterales bacterium]|nr:acyl-ACP--UDP-N-acetylglucosamine O-acyltransferase [Bryobacterales bacterium]